MGQAGPTARAEGGGEGVMAAGAVSEVEAKGTE